jgi:hypothetical protein
MLFTLFLDFLLKQLCERLFRKQGCQVQRRVSGYLKQNFIVKNALSVEYFKLPKETKNQNNFKVYAQSFVFFFLI